MHVDLGDVPRANFHARARRRVYAELSNEDFEEGKCVLLEKATAPVMPRKIGRRSTRR